MPSVIHKGTVVAKKILLCAFPVELEKISLMSAGAVYAQTGCDLFYSPHFPSLGGICEKNRSSVKFSFANRLCLSKPANAVTNHVLCSLLAEAPFPLYSLS